MKNSKCFVFLKTYKNITRRNRTSTSYKITKPQVKTALKLLKNNEQFTMNELVVDMKKKYWVQQLLPFSIFKKKRIIKINHFFIK